MSFHIAFLTPEYPHPQTGPCGGLGTSIAHLARALVTHNVRVTVVVYGQSKDAQLEDQGVVLQLLERQRYRFFGWYRHRKYISKCLNELIRNQQIDLLEVPDWTGISAFMRFPVPVVMRFHGSDTYFCHLEKRKQKWKNRWLEQKAARGAQGFIAPTDFAGNRSAQLLGVDKEVRTLYYGLDMAHFENPDPFQFESGMLLYLGTIIRKKGVLELPFIFRKVREQYPGARLVLAGRDSADAVSGQASTLALMRELMTPEEWAYTDYLGALPYEKLHHLLRRAHVCVFPTFAETLGMVTIEAMAMQKAVVNSNIGWANELMEDRKSGFLVHPSDHDGFAGTILRLLTQDGLTQQIGAEARRFVAARFDIRLTVQDHIEYYNSILNR